MNQPSREAMAGKLQIDADGVGFDEARTYPMRSATDFRMTVFHLEQLARQFYDRSFRPKLRKFQELN